MNIKNKIKIKVNGKKLIFDNNASIEKLTKTWKKTDWGGSGKITRKSDRKVIQKGIQN